MPTARMVGTLAAAAVLFGAATLFGASITWTGTDDGTSWNDAANWDAGVVPTSVDEASFPPITNVTVSLGASRTVGQLKIAGNARNLVFGSPADVSAGYTLNLGTVYRPYFATYYTQTLAAAVAIAPNRGSTTWNVGRYGSLVAAGNINALGKNMDIVGGALIFSGNDTFATMSVAVDTMTMSGTNTFSSMAVNGGTLTLSGANTFSNIAVNGGTLALGSANALGSTGTVSFGGGTLQCFDTTDLSSRFSQDANQLYSVNTSTSVTFTTPLTSSGGSLTKSGNGRLTLSVANSYTGPTTLSAGTLTFSGPGTLGSTTAPLTLAGGYLDLAGETVSVGDVNITSSTFVTNGTLNGTSYTVGGVTPYIYASLAGSGVGVTKSGSGTLVMYGANTYTGDTTINGSTLQLNFTPGSSPINDVINSASALKIWGSTVSVYGKTAASSLVSQTVNGLTVNPPGASSLSIANGIASGSTLFSLGAITRQAGATLNFNQPTVNTSVGPTNGYTTSTTNDASGILGGWATVAGTDWAANNGANIVAYTNYATLAGNAPPMADDPASNVRISNASTGDVSQAAVTNTINTLLFNATASRTNAIGDGNTLRLGAAGGILKPSGGTFTLGTPGANCTLTAGGADNTPGDLVINNASTISNNAVIANNGTGVVSLTKSGSGALVLTKASTYTGGTFLNAGSLYLPGVGGALTTNGTLTMMGGTLDLGGGTLTNRAGMTVMGGVVTNGTLSIQGSSMQVWGGTIMAAITGPGGLVKTTTSTLTLTNAAANTFTGEIIVREGTLSLNTSSALNGTTNVVVGAPEGGNAAAVSRISAQWSPFKGGRSYTVYPNGSINFSDYTPVVDKTVTIIGGSVSGSPTLNAGFGVRMTGGSYGCANYGSANFDITTYATSVSAVISGTLTTKHTLTVADGPAPIDLKVTGAVSGTGITKAGLGVMSVSAANTHSGYTYVSAGTLLVDNFLSLGSGTGKSVVTNALGATLGGMGVIGGVAGYSNANVVLVGAANTNSVSTLAPGSIDAMTGNHIIGTLTVGSAAQSNNVTFGKYARLLVNLGDAAPLNDGLVVNGYLNLGATNNYPYLDVATTAVAPRGGDYTVATFGVLTGRFYAVRSAAGAPLPERYTLNYLGTPSGNGNELLNGSIVLSLPRAGSTIVFR